MYELVQIRKTYTYPTSSVASNKYITLHYIHENTNSTQLQNRIELETKIIAKTNSIKVSVGITRAAATEIIACAPGRTDHHAHHLPNIH